MIRNLPDEILSAWLELIPGNYQAIHIMPPEKHLLPNKDEITSVRLSFHYNGKNYDLSITENDNLKKIKKYLQQNHVIRSNE